MKQHIINLEEAAIEKDELEAVKARLDLIEETAPDGTEMRELHEDIAHLIDDVRALQNTIRIEVE
jgi:hypothetical protein